jgi:hypothetical protein
MMLDPSTAEVLAVYWEIALEISHIFLFSCLLHLLETRPTDLIIFSTSALGARFGSILAYRRRLKIYKTETDALAYVLSNIALPEGICLLLLWASYFWERVNSSVSKDMEREIHDLYSASYLLELTKVMKDRTKLPPEFAHVLLQDIIDRTPKSVLEQIILFFDFPISGSMWKFRYRHLEDYRDSLHGR